MAPRKAYGTGEASEDVKHTPVNMPQNGLVKTQNSFSEDLVNFAEGTVPQSLIVAIVIGTSVALSRHNSELSRTVLILLILCCSSK